MRDVLLRAAALSIGLAAALVAAEIVLRVTGAFPSKSLHTVSAREFEKVPGMFAPGQAMVRRQVRQLPHQVSINSLGFRGAEVSRDKKTDEYRVLFIGDSSTFGDHVDDANTLPSRLEFELQQRCNGVRVLNAGVGGTTIVDHIPIARRFLTLQPDLVILQFTENDVSDLGRRSLWEEIAENRALKSRPPFSVIYRATRSTALWQAALYMKGLGRTRVERQINSGDEGANEARRAQLRQRYFTLVDSLRAELGDLPLVFTAIPSHLTLLGEHTWDQINWLERGLDSAGIPHVRIARRLAATELGVETLYLLPWDGHASPFTYSLVAPWIADALAEGIMAPQCP
jgi:lysophospholipase L1-like esterase